MPVDLAVELAALRAEAARNEGISAYPAEMIRAAEHPAEYRSAHIRDVPEHCICPWRYTGQRFERVRYRLSCPWHTC